MVEIALRRFQTVAVWELGYKVLKALATDSEPRLNAGQLCGLCVCTVTVVVKDAKQKYK